MSALKQKLARVGARAGLFAGATAAVLAFGGAGASSAIALEAHCNKAAAIEAEGSSLQTKAQSVWTGGAGGKGFNGSADATACNGAQGGGKVPTVTYKTSSSGTALAAWGAINSTLNTPTDRFISTDDPPKGPVGTAGTQMSNIRTALRKGGANTTQVATVPVTQTAIAVIVNLPNECTLTQIDNAKLQTAFRGLAKVTWTELGGSGAGCGAGVKRIVRKDSSGTTYHFKRYLFKLNNAKLTCLPAAITEFTWAELQSTTPVGGVTPNTSWPECAGSELETPANNGGGEVVKKVDSTDSSIGYAALPDAKNAANQPKGAVLILKVQNAELGGKPNSWVFPYTAAGENANCTETTYNKPLNEAGTAEITNWNEGGVNLDWSGVYGANPAIGGGKYPICTLTYSIAATDSTNVFTEELATVIHDYLKYVTTGTGGQADVAGNWYAPLPAVVSEAAAKAVAEIK